METVRSFIGQAVVVLGILALVTFSGGGAIGIIFPVTETLLVRRQNGRGGCSTAAAERMAETPRYLYAVNESRTSRLDRPTCGYDSRGRRAYGELVSRRGGPGREATTRPSWHHPRTQPALTKHHPRSNVALDRTSACWRRYRRHVVASYSSALLEITGVWAAVRALSIERGGDPAHPGIFVSAGDVDEQLRPVVARG